MHLETKTESQAQIILDTFLERQRDSFVKNRMRDEFLSSRTGYSIVKRRKKRRAALRIWKLIKVCAFSAGQETNVSHTWSRALATGLSKKDLARRTVFSRWLRSLAPYSSSFSSSFSSSSSSSSSTSSLPSFPGAFSLRDGQHTVKQLHTVPRNIIVRFRELDLPTFFANPLLSDSSLTLNGQMTGEWERRRSFKK